MKKLILYSIVIFSTLIGQDNAPAVLTTSGPTGSSLTTDATGVVTNYTVGTAGGYTPITWLEYATLFVAFNNGMPLEVSGVNVNMWDDEPLRNSGLMQRKEYESHSRKDCVTGRILVTTKTEYGW